MINKKMSEVTVHVTCDISKRIISCTRHNLLSKIKEEFGIRRDDMILQVYDKSWDDWIDIEPLSVTNRSKLKVVMPKIPPREIKKECNGIKEELVKSTSIEKACSALKYVSEEHWKSPYKLPKLSFSMERKLSAQKQLNIAEKRSLVDELYEDIITYIRYPRSSHYHEIATALLTKYPYLSRQANVYETKRHWINLLRKRFKETRSSQNTDEIEMPETSTTEHEGNDSDNETIIYGDSSEVSEVKEDPEKMQTSKYISWMKFEFKKRIQDREKIACLMELTFAERRNFIIHISPRVSVIKEIYPFLFHEDEVKKEYERISGQRLETTFLESLRRHCRRILNLTPDSSPLKQMTLKCMAEAISEKERKHAIGAGALFMLPELLKEELEDFMHFCNTSEKKKDIQPRIECSFTIEEVIRGRGSFKVFVENILLCEPLELVQAFESLSSCYFIFNIVYPQKCLGTLETLQILFLQVDEDKEISRKAERVIAKLESK